MSGEVVSKVVYVGKLSCMRFGENGTFTISVKDAEMTEFLTEFLCPECAELLDRVKVTVELV